MIVGSIALPSWLAQFGELPLQMLYFSVLLLEPEIFGQRGDMMLEQKALEPVYIIR